MIYKEIIIHRCDCGNRFEVGFSDVDAPVACSKCGGSWTFTKKDFKDEEAWNRQQRKMNEEQEQARAAQRRIEEQRRALEAEEVQHRLPPPNMQPRQAPKQSQPSAIEVFLQFFGVLMLLGGLILVVVFGIVASDTKGDNQMILIVAGVTYFLTASLSAVLLFAVASILGHLRLLVQKAYNPNAQL